MRALGILVLLLLPWAGAAEAYVVLLDWQEGSSPAGTTALAISPAADRFAFDVDACHREILVDLDYDPAEAGADVPGIGKAFLQYDFLAQVWAGDALVEERRIRDPAYGIPFGTSEAGPHEIRLSLANGALVSWQLRVRGHEVFDELACEPRVVVNEVEANPNGTDAAKEWVELYNAGDEAADLSLWTLRATHGAPVDLTLGENVLLDPGVRLLVTFSAGQALDNADEVVVLLDAFGRERDRTPAFDDAENDARTWQRVPDGSDAWSFASGTPDAGNG